MIGRRHGGSYLPLQCFLILCVPTWMGSFIILCSALCYDQGWPCLVLPSKQLLHRSHRWLQLPCSSRPSTAKHNSSQAHVKCSFSECTKVWQIIFFFSSEAPGVGSLAAKSYTSTFPSLATELFTVKLIYGGYSDGSPWKSWIEQKQFRSKILGCVRK